MIHPHPGARHALAVAAALAAPNITEPAVNPVIDRGYRQMYNLNFDRRHKTFGQWEREHPADPLGPVSNAAAYLFAEFDRLNILHSEFFVDNGMFHRRPKVTPDPAVHQAFDQELEKSGTLSDQILGRAARRSRCAVRENPDARLARRL